MIPQAGLGYDQLRGERAITSLDKPFTPSRRSTGFTLSTPRSTGFSCHGSDFAHFHTRPLTASSCGHLGFPSFTAFRLILATPMNSLARVSRRMMLIRSTRILQRNYSRFVPRVSNLVISILCIDQWFQVLFTPLPRHFSTFARAT